MEMCRAEAPALGGQHDAGLLFPPASGQSTMVLTPFQLFDGVHRRTFDCAGLTPALMGDPFTFTFTFMFQLGPRRERRRIIFASPCR